MADGDGIKRPQIFGAGVSLGMFAGILIGSLVTLWLGEAAMDLAHHGIRVNTITPYFMEHNLHRFGTPSTFRGRYTATAEDFLKSVPMGRFPRASDLAYAAIFLASDEASFITGIDIPVDGGVRAKYPPWMPGEYTGANITDYIRDNPPQRYGEPFDQG